MSIKLVWVYEDEDEEEQIVMKLFGNRADALVFAYYEAFQAIIDCGKRQDSCNLAKEISTAFPEKDLWPKCPKDCAKFLRDKAKDGYLFDDHMNNSDRWGKSHRQNDLEVRVGDIDISIHDENGSIPWSNFFDITIKQYLVVDKLDLTLITKQKEFLSNARTRTHVGGFDITNHLDKGSSIFEQLANQAIQQNKDAVESSNCIKVIDISKGTQLYFDEINQVFTTDKIENVRPSITL